MASATASSNYTASAAPSSYTSYNDHSMAKFSDYRSRVRQGRCVSQHWFKYRLSLFLQVMLGELPPDFLRLDYTQTAMYNPQGYPMRQGHPGAGHVQHLQNPNFLGLFTLTIAEVRPKRCSSILAAFRPSRLNWWKAPVCWAWWKWIRTLVFALVMLFTRHPRRPAAGKTRNGRRRIACKSWMHDIDGNARRCRLVICSKAWIPSMWRSSIK